MELDIKYSPIAQLVERHAVNVKVLGSSPSEGVYFLSQGDVMVAYWVHIPEIFVQVGALQFYAFMGRWQSG